MTTTAAINPVPPDPPVRIMVASSVYGFQAELEQICAVLRTYSYEVWNSHQGTIKVHPGKSNLENCLRAVEECDCFLGIIRPFYGTGVVGACSITHEEMRRAVTLNKPRWFLVHAHVTFTRQLLRQFLFTRQGKPRKQPLRFRKTGVMDDLRVLEMYDDVIQSKMPVGQRTGNWAQEFFYLSDALRYIETQFRPLADVRKICSELNTT